MTEDYAAAHRKEYRKSHPLQQKQGFIGGNPRQNVDADTPLCAILRDAIMRRRVHTVSAGTEHSGWRKSSDATPVELHGSRRKTDEAEESQQERSKHLPSASLQAVASPSRSSNSGPHYHRNTAKELKKKHSSLRPKDPSP